MNFFLKNMESLKRRFPFLYESLTSQQFHESKYTSEMSRAGLPTLQIDGNYIHSKFDPKREATRFIDNEISREAGIVIFAGMGLGYHIEELITTDNSTEILVIEPDRDLFLFALSVRDLTDLIMSDTVQFLIGGEPEDCALILEQFPGKIVQLIKLRSLYSKDKLFYEKLDLFIQNYVSRKEINLSTLKRFGQLWVRNLSDNAQQLAQAPGIYELAGRMEPFPALLIAAGPSLDKIKPHLKDLKNRFLIVAVDTSLRACLNAGIEPDFTVIVDPQYWNSRHLDHCNTQETILLSETSTYPSVFRQIRGNTFLCSSSFPLGLYLEEKTEIKGKLKAGGSVATAAWDFCRILSIKDIWCAGLDLGFPNKQTHCRGSFFEQRSHWLSSRNSPSETFSWHALHDAGLRTVESNSDNITWTDKRMSLYSRWFEEQMDKYKEIQSWNLSDEGIKIHGMPRKALDDALKKPIIRKNLDSEIKKIKKIRPDSTLSIKLGKAFIELINALEKLKDLSDQGRQISKNLESSFKNNKDLTDNLSKLSVLDNKILNSLSKDIAGFILQNFISSLIRDNKKKTGVEIIRTSYNLYNELYDSVIFHINLLKNSPINTKNTQD